MHLAEVLARDWGYLVQQRKQPIKKCLFCVQWDTAEVVTVSFLWETWSSGHLHALTWPSVLTNRLTTASSDLYSLVAVMSDNVGSDDRGYGDLAKKLFKPNRQLPLNDQCQRVLFLFSFFLFIGQCNVWKYVTVLHIFSCITSEFPWCGQPKPNSELWEVLCKYYLPQMTRQTFLLLMLWSDKQPQAILFTVYFSLLNGRLMLWLIDLSGSQWSCNSTVLWWEHQIMQKNLTLLTLCCKEDPWLKHEALLCLRLIHLFPLCCT